MEPSDQQLFVDLVRTCEHLLGQAAALLRGHELSAPQYNVLRILRGAGSEGLACRQITERMLTPMPDITRLVDRLQAAGLVDRQRGTASDRRIVLVRITERGQRLLAGLDAPMLALHRRQFASLDPGDRRRLGRLLERLREERS